MLVQQSEQCQQCHLNISTFSFRAHQISPSHASLQRASLHSTSSSYHNNNNLSLSITPGPHIYDINSINNMYDCEGGQPSNIGGHRRYYDINQLNREHLRDLPRGLLRRWGILCDTDAVTSVAPRNFPDKVPLQPHYTQLSLTTATNQPIHIYGYKHILLICNNISFPVRLYICDVKDFTTFLTAESSCTSMARIVRPSNIKERLNLYIIIGVFH